MGQYLVRMIQISSGRYHESKVINHSIKGVDSVCVSIGRITIRNVFVQFHQLKHCIHIYKIVAVNNFKPYMPYTMIPYFQWKIYELKPRIVE